MNWKRVFRLDDEAAARVKNRHRMIMPLLDIGRKGTALQRQKSLVGNGTKAIPDNLERDRIEGQRTHWDTSITILCASSIVAVQSGGTTVVISPLIALMKDQVDGLQALGVPAIQLDSSQSAAERFAY